MHNIKHLPFERYRAAYQAAGILEVEERASFLTNMPTLAGKTMLEIGSGDLRFGKHFAKLPGVRYIGVDTSKEMVRFCHEMYPEVDVRHVNFLDFNEPVDVIVFPFNTFPFLSLKEQEQVVQHGAIILRPGGVFLIDTMLPEHNGHTVRKVFPRPTPMGIKLVDDMTCLTGEELHRWLPLRCDMRTILYPFAKAEGKTHFHSLVVIRK